MNNAEASALLASRPVSPIFVAKLAPEPGKGDPDGFALIAAPNAGQARFQLETLIARDFPTLRNSAWTEPVALNGVYRVGSRGVVFLALPKQAPFHINGG